ncbi:hypothetical protein [Microbacterium paraoxydans]|uniref:hypothetical protein n=1 Tax=Microbacterium paraoxydans TaxID=199592 RepID=UPI00046926D1|nr:hypothetical protein [Microbacterium paraoxydans]
MAGQSAQQSAEQKAAAEKVAADKAAAEKAAAEKAAAEKAAAEKIAAEAESERVAAAEAAADTLQVIGPVAVLPLKAGGERYVYRGTPVGEEFTAEGVKHAKAVGLVGKPKK